MAAASTVQQRTSRLLLTIWIHLLLGVRSNQKARVQILLQMPSIGFSERWSSFLERFRRLLPWLPYTEGWFEMMKPAVFANASGFTRIPLTTIERYEQTNTGHINTQMLPKVPCQDVEVLW